MSIRLTDERLAHILEHPEMAQMEQAIEDTLTPLRWLSSLPAMPKPGFLAELRKAVA